jgi:ATP-binding cassette, subfamily B, bacterial
MAGLDKDEYDRSYSDKELLVRIIGYFAKYKKEMIIVSITVVLSAFGNALVPILTSSTLDQIVEDMDQGSSLMLSNQVLILCLLILGFAIFGFIMNALSQIFGAIAVQSSVYDIRNDVFDSLLVRDMSFFAEQPTGRLVSRVTNDTNDFGQTVSLTTNLLGQILIFVFVLAYLFGTSIRLTIMILIFAPIILLVALSFRKIARNVAIKSNRILAKVNALIQETTSGIYIAKSFRAEDTIYDEFQDMNNTSYIVNVKRGLVFNSIFPILQILTGIATAGIVYFGALDAIGETNQFFSLFAFLPGNQLTVGEWYLFIIGLNFFFFPLIQIASFWSQFQQGLAGSERVFSLMDAENEVRQIDSIKIDKIEGEITFKDVDFGYKDDIKVFENFYLTIKAGEKIAIVGHTGAGKSTISKIISRYYDFQKGEVLIDGIDIRSLDLNNYRNQLAVISQEVFLWNASIKENILYGSYFETVPAEKNKRSSWNTKKTNSPVNIHSNKQRPSSKDGKGFYGFSKDSQLKMYSKESEEKMIGILQEIEALDWINNLEGGFEMKVGERGNRLSQGQRQLIQFARILMQDPSILIMDEATASVDPFTELQIQKATDLLMKNRTSIIIAHRLSTIKNCDRIIVLDQGKIIEEGSHNQLMTNSGHYRELYDTYFRHQSLEYVEKVSKEI